MLSWLLFIGGILLMNISWESGFGATIGGGLLRKGLDESLNAEYRPLGTRWFHHAMAGYMVLSALLSVYLAYSGFWQKNGSPTPFQFFQWSMPIWIVVALEERIYYRKYIAGSG